MRVQLPSFTLPCPLSFPLLPSLLDIVMPVVAMSGVLILDSAVHLLTMLSVNSICCVSWVIGGHLRPKTLSNYQRACSGQQRALKCPQRALSLRHTGDDFKIDRVLSGRHCSSQGHSGTQRMFSRSTESSQDGIVPHRVVEGPPRPN